MASNDINQINKTAESQIRISREEMVAGFVEVAQAPQILIDKLTGERSHETKVFHLFSRYTVRPVACSKDAGTTLKKQIPHKEHHKEFN